MTLFELRLKIFFAPKILVPVILAGVIGFFLVDGFVHTVMANIHFSGPTTALEDFCRELLLNRGARAVWLWTFLPVQIAWLYAGSAIAKIQKFT